MAFKSSQQLRKYVPKEVVQKFQANFSTFRLSVAILISARRFKTRMHVPRPPPTIVNNFRKFRAEIRENLSRQTFEFSTSRDAQGRVGVVNISDEARK